MIKSAPSSPILLLFLREYQRYLSLQGAFRVTVRELKNAHPRRYRPSQTSIYIFIYFLF